MTPKAATTPASAALIDGRSAFTAALHQALSQAARERARELCFVDPDFEAWPLDDPLVLSALTAWARLPKRQLLLIACRFDDLPRRCPRFTAWRRDWAHVIECRATEIETSQVPTLLLAGPIFPIKTGRYHDLRHGKKRQEGVPNNRLLVSIARLFGAQLDRFGESKASSLLTGQLDLS